VQIPDETFWGALTFMGAIITWLVRLERRLNERMTFKDHTEICDKVNGEIRDKIDELKDLLERQNEQSSLHRSLVGEALASIRTQLAVVRDRMGDDPLKDVSGRYRRGEGAGG
jgi:hypothetical protein